jgi:hypothetical protein
MAEGNNKPPVSILNFEGDELDRALDSALAKYTAIEPRAGLEERILARLQCERKHPAAHSSWRWSVAAAVMVTILVAISLAWRWSKRRPAPVANLPSTIQRPVDPAKQSASASVPQAVPPKSAVSARRPGASRSVRAVVAVEPKLDQFPSPQPLSQEELALARYVRSFPKEATLIAQAQQEFEIETQKQMNAAGAQTQTSGSMQQER